MQYICCTCSSSPILFFVYAVEKYVMALSDIYLCLPWAMLFFAFMTVLGSVSYRLIESPFLRYRKRYVVENERNVLTVSYLKAA